MRGQGEHDEELADFAGFLATEDRELRSTQHIQRVYRGHIGRKAANRWGTRRAEFVATNSIMVAAAIAIQRLVRGSWGRTRANDIRAGIARWLVHLVVDANRDFEAEVLGNNHLEALKRET